MSTKKMVAFFNKVHGLVNQSVRAGIKDVLNTRVNPMEPIVTHYLLKGLQKSMAKKDAVATKSEPINGSDVILTFREKRKNRTRTFYVHIQAKNAIYTENKKSKKSRLKTDLQYKGSRNGALQFCASLARKKLSANAKRHKKNLYSLAKYGKFSQLKHQYHFAQIKRVLPIHVFYCFWDKQLNTPQKAHAILFAFTEALYKDKSLHKPTRKLSDFSHLLYQFNGNPASHLLLNSYGYAGSWQFERLFKDLTKLRKQSLEMGNIAFLRQVKDIARNEMISNKFEYTVQVEPTMRKLTPKELESLGYKKKQLIDDELVLVADDRKRSMRGDYKRDDLVSFEIEYDDSRIQDFREAGFQVSVIDL